MNYTNYAGQVVSQTRLKWDGRDITAENPKRKLIVRELGSVSENQFVGTVKGMGATMSFKPGDLISFDVNFAVNNKDDHIQQVVNLNRVMKLKKEWIR